MNSMLRPRRLSRGLTSFMQNWKATDISVSTQTVGRISSTSGPISQGVRDPNPPSDHWIGLAIANVIKQLRPLRSATIAINGTTETFPPQIPPAQKKILDSLGIPEPGH